MPDKPSLSAEEAHAIAKDAYIYGFPLVDNYRIQYSYFVDRGGPEYKAPWNTLYNNARVYTPEDKAIQTPNSDTPYSYIGADLRAEPLVFSVPAVEKNRYYALQFIDMYTFNFAYVGSRTTGNDAGSFLLAGPRWHGETPPGIKAVIKCETDFAFVLYRTQLFEPADIEKVKKIQAQYKVQTLSGFSGRAPPSSPAPADFIRPPSAEEEKSSLEFFNILSFVLQFCPTHPTEKDLMARFARLNIGSGKRFDAQALAPEIRAAVQAGVTDAWKVLADIKAKEADTGKLGSGDVFGTRAFLKNNYLYRMAAAVLGIYGNSKEEAMYPMYYVDATGEKLDAAKARYRLHFGPDQLPPAHAFWSLTLYELPSSLLSANPLNRYLINSPMLPNLKRDADGGLTLYIQHDSPEGDEEADWLPAPSGPFFVTLRLYWPEAAALDGTWKAPALQRVH